MKTAVKITSKSRNSTFEGCNIHGGIENSGKNTKFIKTSIGLGIKQFNGKHPILYGSISAIIGGIITLVIEKIFFQ